MSQSVTYDFFRNYDVTSVTDFTYGKFDMTFRSLKRSVKTSGSSTTVSEDTSGDGSFAQISVGDELYNPVTGDRVLVTAKASDAEITVSSAVNWAAHTNIQFRKFLSGTGAGDGWIDVEGMDQKTVTFAIDTFTATSISATIEGRNPGQTATTIYSFPDQTAVSVSGIINSITPVKVSEQFKELRFGVKLTGDGGAQSISAHFNGHRL